MSITKKIANQRAASTRDAHRTLTKKEIEQVAGGGGEVTYTLIPYVPDDSTSLSVREEVSDWEPY